MIKLVIFFLFLISVRVNAQNDSTINSQKIPAAFLSEPVDSNYHLVINNTRVGTIREIKKDLITLFDPKAIDTVLIIKKTNAFNWSHEKNTKDVIHFILKAVRADTSKKTDYITLDQPLSSNAWRQNLQNWINPETPTENNAPRGKYKVTVQFRTGKDGTISHIMPLTNYGYGMEEQLIRAIVRFKGKEPYTYEGKPATLYRKQSVVFTVD